MGRRKRRDAQERRAEAFVLFSRGLSVAEVARVLDVAPRTVERYRQHGRALQALVRGKAPLSSGASAGDRRRVIQSTTT